MTRPGRPPTDPAEFAARKHEFEALKARLGATAPQIAVIAGISTNSVRRYQGPRSTYAPTRQTLDAMRREVLRRLKIEEAAAAIAAAQARQARIRYERELAA